MFEQSKPVYIILYILVFLILILITVVVFIIKSRKKILQKELEKKDLELNFQKNILLSTIQTQEKERSRIAQDLHDEISSKLNVVSLNLYRLKSSDNDKSDKHAVIDTIINVNNSAIENARKIAHNLLPPVLEKFGLKIAIEELVLDLEKTKILEIDYINDVDFSKTDMGVQLNIFRILQELINNSLKHGKAKKIKIKVNGIDSRAYFYYSDNGVGFDISDFKKRKGLGMYNIESRIQFLNAEYKIDSKKNHGFTFTFNLNI
jgi:signal transduction histidine kinase